MKASNHTVLVPAAFLAASIGQPVLPQDVLKYVQKHYNDSIDTSGISIEDTSFVLESMWKEHLLERTKLNRYYSKQNPFLNQEGEWIE
jgi:hypothetical protein